MHLLCPSLPAPAKVQSRTPQNLPTGLPSLPEARFQRSSPNRPRISTSLRVAVCLYCSAREFVTLAHMPSVLELLRNRRCLLRNCFHFQLDQTLILALLAEVGMNQRACSSKGTIEPSVEFSESLSCTLQLALLTA